MKTIKTLLILASLTATLSSCSEMYPTIEKNCLTNCEEGSCSFEDCDSTQNDVNW